MFDLSGKSAFVTGAASGIGESIAFTLARAGAFVYVDDVNTQSGKEVVARINSDRQNSEFVHVDVTKIEECNAAAARVHKNRGPLDILVNNAGMGHVGTILSTDAGDLERLFAVNV